jgi:hypothetical protein
MKPNDASWNKALSVNRPAQKTHPTVNRPAVKPGHFASSEMALAIVVFLFVVFLSTALTAGAENYSIGWYKVAGGGGTSTGAVYSVSGTIGQHDAGGPLVGGNFSLMGGYWSFPTVQTLGAPSLRIVATSPNTLMVYWPSPSTGFNLQVNTDLTTARWVPPTETVQDDGTIRYIIIVSPAPGQKFYRLNHP